MIRELVRRLQFTDDTTIDGNRLDGLMQAFVDRFNALTPRDIERNWTETVFVSGYQPAIPGGVLNGTKLPWMSPKNQPPAGGLLYQAVDESLFYPTNEYRSKGWGLPWLDTAVTLGDGNYFQWSSSFHVFRPTIITKLMFVMRTDSAFTNPFIYGPAGGTVPSGKSQGDPSDDFTIELAIDNPFTQENRSQSNTEVLRTRFPASAWTMNTDMSADMQPAYPASAGPDPTGVYVNLDVEVPVPQNARVRLNLVIPQYSDGVYDTGWGDEDAYAKQYYSVAINMLEKS